MAHKLFLIETSATLRHATKKLLHGHGHQLTIENDFAAALNYIQDNARSYDAVIIGWPARTDNNADELLAYLLEEENNLLPVLIMAHEADTPKLNWLSQRKHSTLLLWDDYREITNSINQIIQVKPERNVIRPEILSKASQTPIRVLFVDDSPTVRVSYRRLLTKYGYETDTASGIAEAMEKAIANDYDIAIVDYFMPDGTGDNLCRMLRDDRRTAKITSAIITGTYLNDAIIGSLEAGAVECMFKNEGQELFLARIDAMSRAVRVRNSIEKDHQRLEGILASVGDGVYGVDTEGLITFINPAAKEILGYEEDDELLGKSPYKMFHHEHQDGTPKSINECPLQRAYGNGYQFVSRETTFLHKEGNHILIECTIYPLQIEGKMEGSVVAFRDITERKLLEDELKWQATHDSLTGLPNRAYFEEQLGQEVRRLNRSNESSALLYLDLDRFKYINDTAGHAAGDQLLIELAKELCLRMRKADVHARIGGDEFASILRNIKVDQVEELTNEFRKLIEDFKFVYKGKDYNITASFGVTILNRETDSYGDALANADIACYISKNRGRNVVHIYDSENDAKTTMDMELGWSTRIKNALSNDEFELHFQPIVPLDVIDIDNIPSQEGEIWQRIKKQANAQIYFEALIRLRDASGSIVAPGAFLPTAERFNMMPDLDRWVIKHSVEKLSANPAFESVKLSINLSGQGLQDKEMAGYIRNLVKNHNIKAEQLCFEITETSAIANFDDASRLIEELKEFGCSFSLDDFGSGFCSFSHLKFLTVDTIKIDGIFVQGMLTDDIDQAIIQSIVQIAHSTGKRTVAEYVENAEILTLLKETGVDAVQGYFVSRPIESLEEACINDKQADGPQNLFIV